VLDSCIVNTKIVMLFPSRGASVFPQDLVLSSMHSSCSSQPFFHNLSPKHWPIKIQTAHVLGRTVYGTPIGWENCWRVIGWLLAAWCCWFLMSCHCMFPPIR